MKPAAQSIQPARAERAEALEALEAVFEAHYPRVVGLLARLTGDADTAEELAVETFTRFWQSPPRQRDNPGGWLARVALNLGYNRLRAARRRQRYEQQAGFNALEQASPPDPADLSERLAERRRVRAALARLPARDARLLALHSAGYSYRESAEILKINPASLGRLLARALQRFERIYREGEPDETPD